METLSNTEENYYLVDKHKEILKKSFNFFDIKSNIISKEVDAIKDFIKFLICKSNNNIIFIF